MGKFSIITLSLNNKDTIKDNIYSVDKQTYKNIEHLCLDGYSSDGTYEILKKLKKKWRIIKQSRLNGVYSNLNRASKYLKGDYIGLLHSDDIFYNSNPKLKFKPGEKYEYSNTGYLVLASIVEEVSKQHFSEFLKENIFDPLNMNNTLLYSYKEGYDSDMPNRVFGYSLDEEKDGYKLNDYHVVNDVRGDGGIYSTINDLFKWNMALLDYKVVPKKLLDEAWIAGTLNNGEDFGYGYGWFIGDSSKPKSVFHSGGWVGFVTYLYNEIDTKSGYVILTNDSSRVLVDIINSINSIRETGKYVSK